jgi:hypothetical protein
MPIRHRVLLAALTIAWIAFIVMASVDPNFTKLDVAAAAAFGLVVLAIAAYRLASIGTIQRYRGLPRLFREIGASFAMALGAMILVAVLALPFVGSRVFDLLDGQWYWAVYFLLAVVAYPFVHKRLQ